MTALAQVLTMVLAAVVIVWHQQRTADKIRAEFRTEIARLDDGINMVRAELTERLDQMRAESTERLDQMRAEFTERLDQMRAEFDAKLDQQRAGFDAKLDQQRAGFDAKLDQQRAGFDAKLDQMYVGFTSRLDLIQAEVAASGQRLARIEGFLGIGIPEEVAGAAAGARFATAGADGG